MDKDFLKEKLIFLRLWLTFVITIESACIAWFVANYNKVVKIFVYADIILVLTLFISTFIINQKIRKNIKIMRDLNNE
ncbi:MAG: hypothetical protein A2039_02295 [Candidatus Melainabacteria bacterium GWA2_34_9]|nr:MAG: hypothetical protein A2039_02295 [Candidatus Melainabacteria bacterium GWA2_34_9]